MLVAYRTVYYIACCVVGEDQKLDQNHTELLTEFSALYTFYQMRTEDTCGRKI